MEVVVIVQESEKVSDIVSVLRKRSRVFDGDATVEDIMDWANSFINRVGDIKFIPVNE